MDHELKCWPAPFEAVISGTKRHEIRVFDRPFAEGDTLTLREWNPDTKEYTGRTHGTTILYVTKPGEWGLPAGIGCFSIGVTHNAQAHGRLAEGKASRGARSCTTPNEDEA